MPPDFQTKFWFVGRLASLVVVGGTTLYDKEYVDLLTCEMISCEHVGQQNYVVEVSIRTG